MRFIGDEVWRKVNLKWGQHTSMDNTPIPAALEGYRWWTYTGKGPRWYCYHCRGVKRELFSHEEPSPDISYGVSLPVSLNNHGQTEFCLYKWKWYCWDCLRAIGVLW